MSEIRLPTLREAKRRIYLITWSGYEGPHRWRWECPTGCGFKVDEERERDAEQAANGHECEAGWCAVPMTLERVSSIPLLPDLTVTPEDRERWARLRVQRDLAKVRTKAKPRL